MKRKEEERERGEEERERGGEERKRGREEEHGRRGAREEEKRHYDILDPLGSFVQKSSE